MTVKIDFIHQLQALQMHHINSFLSKFDAGFQSNAYIDPDAWKIVHKQLNLSENTLSLLRSNSLAKRIFAGQITNKLSYDSAYWQNKQIQAINEGLQNKIKIVPDYRVVSPKLPALTYKLSGNDICGLVINRVTFTNQQKYTVIEELTQYCKWAAKYLDPKCFFIVILDELTENKAIQQLVTMCAKHSNIIIKDHVGIQKWLIKTTKKVSQEQCDESKKSKISQLLLL